MKFIDVAFVQQRFLIALVLINNNYVRKERKMCLIFIKKIQMQMQMQSPPPPKQKKKKTIDPFSFGTK